MIDIITAHRTELRTIYDWQSRRYREVVVSDIGRAAPQDANTGDELLGDEPRLGIYAQPRTKPAPAARLLGQRAAQHLRLLEQATTADLARHMGKSWKAVYRSLEGSPEAEIVALSTPRLTVWRYVAS